MNMEILYQDNDILAINKPHGLLVHKTKLDFNETQSAVDYLREAIGSVFPVHRLDKPTAGVLLFALSSEMARKLSLEFAERRVKKEYLAIVRGVPKDEVLIDHPLKEEMDDISDKKANKNKPPQDAVTQIQLLSSVELPIQVDKYPTSRYSLVLAKPLTGRKHQIRRHLRHINHPIIGDITHGSGKHNRFFESQFKIRKLLLTCTKMNFTHPRTGIPISIEAPVSEEFQKILTQFNWTAPRTKVDAQL